MFASYTPAQEVGFALVTMALVLIAAGMIRRKSRLLRRFHLPASVIAGFLILLAGPQVFGALPRTDGVFPDFVLDTWNVLPGLMINVVFGAIMVGKAIPSVSKLWSAAAPHTIFGTLISLGQFALGAWAVLLILGPMFDLPDTAGSLIEASFSGGHGTIAGMSSLYEAEGAPELVDLGLGMATVSMIIAIVVGAILVNRAIESADVPMVRTEPVSEADDLELDTVRLAPVDVPADTSGLSSATFGFALIGAAIALGIVILELLRAFADLVGTDAFDHFPLFPLTVIGGLIVQLLVTRLGQTHRVDKRSVDGLATLALDVLIASAIGTMSLATLGENIPALVVMSVIAAVWSVVALKVIAPRIHRRNWFEHGIADFGQSQGNVATGFVLVDMVDPERSTSAANDYGYKQLIYEPFFGGGIVTALSVPLIVSWGLFPFALVCTAAAAVCLALGVRRRG